MAMDDLRNCFLYKQQLASFVIFLEYLKSCQLLFTLSTSYVVNNGKLRVYKNLKINFGCERYLYLVQNFKYRQAVTKLRISAHRLPVETGRYNNVPYNDRLCKHCDINEIGNEYHFLMSCRNSKFISLRNIFINYLCKINRSFCLFTQQDIFRYIMAIQDKTIMNLVAKYCYDILAVFGSLN